MAWQGWAVILVYTMLAAAGIPLIQARSGSIPFILYLLALTLMLCLVCWLKGEKPH